MKVKKAASPRLWLFVSRDRTQTVFFVRMLGFDDKKAAPA